MIEHGGGGQELMSDYKHLNTHPDFVSVKELSNWAADHPDLWVQQLAKIVSNVDNIVSPGQTIAEFCEEYTESCSELRFIARDAEDRLDEADRAKERAEIDRDALIYDLSGNEQAFEIKSLKANIVEKHETIVHLRRQIEMLGDQYHDLEIVHADLQAKWKTWTIIAT